MDRRVGKTKKAIQEAYFDLLMEKRNEKITISEIARRADIDRKTFYLHYDTVDDIIREYAKKKTREVLTQLTMRSFFSFRFDRKIFAETANAMIREHMTFLQVIARTPGMRFFWDQVQDTSVEMLVEIYGRHTKMAYSDMLMQVSFFVAGAAYTYQRYLRGEIDCSLDEVSARVSDIAFTGVQGILRQA